MNNPVFGKAIENVKKHKDVILATTEARQSCLVSEPNCHSTIVFSKNLSAIEMQKKYS